MTAIKLRNKKKALNSCFYILFDCAAVVYRHIIKFRINSQFTWDHSITVVSYSTHYDIYIFMIQMVHERNESHLFGIVSSPILRQGRSKLNSHGKFLPVADARFASTVHPIPAREYIRVVLFPLGTRTHTN